MHKTQINFAYFFLFFCFIIAVFFLYLVRLFLLQVVSESWFRERSLNERQRSQTILSQRGSIFDRNEDIPLVENTLSFSVGLDLYKFNDMKKEGLADSCLAYLSQYFKKSLSHLSYLVNRAIENKEEFLILKENLDLSQILPLAEVQDTYPALYWKDSTTRKYESLNSLIHILGYVGKIEQNELRVYYNRQYNLNSLIGKMGVESFYDEVLRGKDGIQYISVNAKGSQVSTSQSILPQPGKDLILTIDRNIQSLAEKSLGKRHGSAIVLKPTTGEILALASYPWYSPFNLQEVVKDTKEENYSFINRAFQGNYPAASSFKLIVAAALLQEKAFDPKKKIFCPGYYQAGDRIFHCHKKEGHGWLNLEEAIRDSCNVYFYTVGLEYLGAQKIMRYAQLLGLGERTKIDLLGEAKGFIPSLEWKEKVIGSPWVGGDTLNLSIGQGYMTTTPLQMANVISAIVNEGQVFQPHILKAIKDPFTKKYTQVKPEVLRTVNISPENFQALKKAMRGVVKDGSLKWVINTPVKIAGKTGTAEQWGYEDNSSWFVSYGPYDAPKEEQVVVVVMVEARNKWEWWAPKAASLIYHGIFHHLSYQQVLEELKPWWHPDLFKGQR